MRNLPFLLCCGFILTGSLASAEDWPRWMGAKYDGVWREDGIIDKFPANGPDVTWRKPIGAGYAGPAVVNGQIFVMDRTKDAGKGIETENNIRKAGEIPGGERILCLDEKSGEVVWEHQYDCPYYIAYPTGPRCTPTVDGKHVYTLGAMGHLKCLDTTSGNIIWEKVLTKEYKAKPPLWGYAAHPYVDGEFLIVPVGGEGSGLVAFNKQTGAEVWRAVTTFDIGYAPTVIYEPKDGPRQLVFWHGAGITAVNPKDGTEYWTVKFPEERNASVVTIATPLIVGNRLLITEFYKGSLLLELAANPPAAKEVWRDSKKKSDARKLALNSMITTPVIKDGHAFGIGFDGRGRGVLRCIELATGNAKWTEDSWMSEKPLMFASGFLTPQADRYFIFNDIGELLICQMSTAGFKELDRAKLLEPTSVARGRDVVWSHPAYADGNIIVRNDKEIICVNLKK